MRVPLPPDPPPEPDGRTRLAYGIGGLPSSFGNLLLRNLTVPFFHLTLHLDPALLGIALAIPRVWDALLDPIVGHISDRTRTRWGRRRPYIIAGALTGAVSFSVIWWAPTHWEPMAQVTWLLVTSLVFYTFHNFWAIPYLSLGYELSSDYHGRTRVMAVYGVFLKIAELLSHWIFPFAQLAMFGSVVGGVRFVGLAVGVLVFGAMGIIPGLFVRERFPDRAPPARGEPHSGFFTSLAEAVRHRGFLLLLVITLLKVIVGMFANSLDYYLLVYYVHAGDLVAGSIWKGALTSAAAIVGLLAIGPITRMSRRMDKAGTLKVLYLLLALGGLAKWWVFRPGHHWLLLLDPLLCGPIWVATSMLLPSMLADVCDEDEWQTERRREGLFSSVMLCLQQAAVALALYFSGAALNWIGFDVARGAAQTPQVIFLLRLLLAGTTVVVALVSIVVLQFYALTPERVREIGAALRQRRAAQAAR